MCLEVKNKIKQCAAVIAYRLAKGQLYMTQNFNPPITTLLYAWTPSMSSGLCVGINYRNKMNNSLDQFVICQAWLC